MIIGTTWGPGGELIYATVRDDDSHVMSLRLDTAGLPLTEARELFLGEVGGASPIRSWDLSADGQRILALQAAEDDALAEPPASVIHLVLNWATELRTRQ